jgi:lipopolysaccharide/colanic/teichoic acid biosynthesis glycosyltransferase
LEILAEPIGGFQALVKRMLDIAVSVLVLMAAAPLLLAIALAIKLKSPGPVIYSQERVGREGVVFNLYKFRSMVAGAERATGPVWSSAEDARIIPGIGHFIRRTGLDELPQFWNVLNGRMSLVGPRPERAYFFDSYPELYRGRLTVRPGLTGLAQVSCRPTRQVEEKVSQDLCYIRNYSIGLDLEILWRTSVMLVRDEWRALFGRRRQDAAKSPADAALKEEKEAGPGNPEA